MSVEGAPVLCKRCGAPTEAQADLSVRCPFCGMPDRLPSDDLGRALEIRGRLTMAAARAAQMASSDAALASIFERRGAFWTVTGPFPILALIVVAYGVFAAYSTLSALPASVPDSVRLDLVVASAYAPVLFLGITVSLPLALLVGRLSYRRKVRPLLAARPPRHAGAAMRCRACGGDLAPTRDAFVACRFCRTQIVLAAELARDAARRLDEELAAYRAQANGVLAGTSCAATHMTRTVFVCFAVVYVGMFALGVLARVAFAALGSPR